MRETHEVTARPTLLQEIGALVLATVLVGARNEAQFRENLGAVGWKLTADQIARLDKASAVTPIYPYWHQRSTMGSRNPPLV